ncbi:Tricalbin-2 [Tieghemiomyces parasiticus]|uniref:Tricalbin-2 n=1 Tax=Tieghemiomyces parasiticus TaxID=78921 RepID=A0A9W7ZRN9_9FUNG|nr:Tricalbin-2 [Tieghemiomyces parasiticus]
MSQSTHGAAATQQHNFSDEQKAMRPDGIGNNFDDSVNPQDKRQQVLDEAANPAAQKLTRGLHKAHKFSNHPDKPGFNRQPSEPHPPTSHGSSSSSSGDGASLASSALGAGHTPPAPPPEILASAPIHTTNRALGRPKTITIRTATKRSNSRGPTSPASPTSPAFAHPGSPLSADDNQPLDPAVAGWREAGAVEAQKGTGPLDTVQALLDQFDRSETYRNAAVLMVTVPITWFLTKIGAGIFGCLVVMAFVATYYRNAVSRFRYRVRDDIRRELILPQFETGLESVEWLNAFMTRFWLTFEPALSAIVIEQADAILAANTPGFINSVRLTTFTLGSKAPRIESVRTFGKDDPDVILMDWEASFTPNDVSDLTPREREERVNPKIVLTIRVGKGVVGAGMPILVEDMVFSGKLRVKLRLMPTLPLVKTVEVSFLSPPMIDFVLKPVGGDTLGFDVTNIPGLKSFIQEQINANMGPMLYSPNAFLVDVDAMMNGANSVASACGVFMMTVRSARNLPNIDRLGTIDPFVRVNVGGKIGALETPPKHNTANPSYDFSSPLLLMNITDTMEFEVLTGRKTICTGSFDLARLQEEVQLTGETTPLTRNGKPAGELYWSGAYFPVATPVKDAEGTELPMESNSGLLRFTVVQASDLDTRHSSVGQYSPYVVVYLNGKVILRTKTMKRSNKPMWSESHELFVADKERTNLRFVMRDSRLHTDLDLGILNCPLEHGLSQVEKQNAWFPLKGPAGGRLRLDFAWRPVLVDEGFAAGGTDPATLPSIGVVKLNLLEARGLRNVEQIGKSDPYVKVLVHTKQQARTRIIENDLDPVWHETFVIPVHRINETVVLECMDYNKVEKDRTLGETFFQVRQLLGDQTAPGTYALGPALRAAANLRQHSGKMKGTLYYTAEFFPILPITPDAPIVVTDPVTGETRPPKDELDSHRKSVQDAPREATAKSGESPPAQPTASPSLSTATTAQPESPETNAAVGEEPNAPHPPAPSRHLTVNPPHPANSDDVTPANPPSSSVADFTDYTAGIVRLTVHEARGLQSAAPVQVLVSLNDNEYNPAHRTAFARGSQVRKWDEVCQFATPELDYNYVSLALHSDEDNDRLFLGKWTLPMRELLTPEYLRPENGVWLPLEQKTGEVRVSFDFVPTEMEMAPSESITNFGILHLEVVEAADLAAADNSGTSDPYVVVSMNGEKVHKTQAIKKTLNPVWHSTCEIPITARHIAHLQLEVFDWNKIQNHTRLGLTDIELGALPVDELVTGYYPIYDRESRPSGGVILRMLFNPRYVNECEQRMTKMQAAESVVKAPIRMATGSAHLAGKALGKGGHVVGGGAKALVNGLGSITRINRIHRHGPGPHAGGQSSTEGDNESGPPRGPGISTVELAGRVVYPPPNEVETYVRLEDLVKREGTPQGEAAPQRGQAATRQAADGASGSSSLRNTGTAAYPNAAVGPTVGTIPGDSATDPRGAGATSGATMEPGTLSIHVQRAENLPAVDSNGLSDPYVRAKMNGRSLFKTKVQKKTLNPTWDEEFKVSLSGTDEDVINLTVRDHNTFSGDRDLWSYDLRVWQYITPERPHADVAVTSPAEDHGLMHLTVEFIPQIGSTWGMRSDTKTTEVGGGTGDSNTPNMVPPEAETQPHSHHLGHRPSLHMPHLHHSRKHSKQEEGRMITPETTTTTAAGASSQPGVATIHPAGSTPDLSPPTPPASRAANQGSNNVGMLQPPPRPSTPSRESISRGSRLGRLAGAMRSRESFGGGSGSSGEARGSRDQYPQVPPMPSTTTQAAAGSPTAAASGVMDNGNHFPRPGTPGAESTGSMSPRRAHGRFSISKIKNKLF